jgi:hypothetical protein
MNDSALNGRCGRVRTIVHAKFVQNVLHMVLGSGFRDI